MPGLEAPAFADLDVHRSRRRWHGRQVEREGERPGRSCVPDLAWADVATDLTVEA